MLGIYLVVAIIIYGFIYYFFFARNSFSYNQTGQGSKSVSQVQQIENTVTLTADGFSPPTLTIKSGTQVTWINKSGTDATVNSDPHPIHTDYPPLNLGNFADGETLSLTFDKPGTYSYHNHFNPGQKGRIVVQ